MAQGSAPDNHHQQKKLQLNNDGQSNSSGSGSGSGSGNSGSSSPSANASTGLKKGPWTAAEDAVLIEYVKKHGEGNWNAVQRNAGLARCGKSCRLRWTNHLRPNLKKGSFTPEEERMIIKLHAQLGNKWARMAAQLPGRTDNEIKNYWNTRIKRRIRQGLPLYPQDVTSQPRASSAPSTLPGESPPSSTNTHLQTQAAISTHLIPNGPTNQTLSPTLNAMLLPPPYAHQHHYLKPCFNNSLFDPSSSLSSPKSTAFTTSNSKPFLRCSSLMFNPSHNETTNFSLSSPPVSVMSSIPSSQPLIPSQLPNTTSTFQFNPLSCSLNPADNLQSQPDSDQYFSCISIHSTKPELPSSQFYLCQIEKSGEKPVLGRSNSMLLLDDLLEDAQAAASSENPQSPTLMNLQEEKLDVSVKAGCSWDATSSVITPAGNLNHHHSDINGHEDFHLPPVQDVAGADNETTQEMQRLQKDLLKILNVVPGFLKRVKDEAGLKKKTKTSDDCMQDDVPKLLNAGGDTPAVTNESKGEYLNGQLSAYASAGGGDTMKGFEMEQQVASFFSIETPDFGQTLDSCSWDNLPGIC